MATILLLRFPFGRYHANPWARHVNEGAVEIPPSPWRLLRALYAVWRTRVPELGEEVVHALLAELAAPPTFHVPRHTIAHTRHYYPDSRDGTDRTLDAFAVLSPQAELAAQWPGELPDALRPAFERLAASMPYLGRADSLCEARVAAQWRPSDHETWVPVDVAEDVAPHATATTVLAPELPLRLETLMARAVDVRRGGLLFPEGSRFVGYQRHAELVPLRRPPRAGPGEPTAVRFSVLQAAFPPETEALVYTDLLRQAALSKLKADPEDRPRTLLGGRTTDGRPMEGHAHAHYLPVLRDRRLTELIVWVPAGLPEPELVKLAAVTELRSSWEKDWRLDVRVAGYGGSEEVAPELVGPARVWRSRTPFVPRGYRKQSDTPKKYAAREIARELRYRGMPAPESVEVVPARDPREFVRQRPSQLSRRSSRGSRPGFFLELTFDEARHGPIALGYLSHFGLGLFEPGPGG